MHWLHWQRITQPCQSCCRAPCPWADTIQHSHLITKTKINFNDDDPDYNPFGFQKDDGRFEYVKKLKRMYRGLCGFKTNFCNMLVILQIALKVKRTEVMGEHNPIYFCKKKIFYCADVLNFFKQLLQKSALFLGTSFNCEPME